MATTTPYDGPVVDAHQHFWDPTRNRHPWLEPGAMIPFRYGDYGAIKRPYLPPEYRADVGSYDVRMTVYVETEWDPNDPVGEVRYASSLAAEHGWPNAIVAQAWLDREDVEEVLASHAEFPLVRGVRHKPGGATSPVERAAGQRTMMMDDRWRRGYAVLGSHGLNFDLQTPWWNLDDACSLAEDFPDTQIIINHAALPADRRPTGLRDWRAAIERAAEHPNIAIKVSGIGDPPHLWTAAAQRPIITAALDSFGVERVMFASNFPVDSLCARFSDIYDGFSEITADLQPGDRRKVFHDNAVRIYRLKPSIERSQRRDGDRSLTHTP
jgi:predicted TIM-barrel fold metal-dependent hydrolase